MSANSPRLIPLWIKVAYTIFLAVLIPIYLRRYGPTNFLYFCDLAFFATLIGIWLESSLVLSAALVGIFLPQMLWVLDFFFELAYVLDWSDYHLTSMTEYMFRPPWFLRFLSFYHFWLPFFLMYLVRRVGFNRRGILLWTGVAWISLTICYAWMPPCSPSKDPDGNQLRDPDQPVNINYVYNIASDEEPQTWMDPDLYFATYMVLLVVAIYWPAHLLFGWWMPSPHSQTPPQAQSNTVPPNAIKAA
jgi:hypothetical protein